MENFQIMLLLFSVVYLACSIIIVGLYHRGVDFSTTYLGFNVIIGAVLLISTVIMNTVYYYNYN